jgi:C-terminal processing protease CtpA/Prc
MGVARADGSNDAKRIADLEVLGTSKYEAFDVFFPLYYPTASSTYRFKVRRPGAKRIEMVEAAMISSSARQPGLPELDPMSPAWTLTYPKKDVALLEMPTWAMYNRNWGWKAFLQTSFDELVAKSIPNLVIDLRGNEGGDSVGDFILPRLVKEKVATENFQRYTRYRSVPQDLRANLSTWDSSFYDWGKSAKPDPNGFFKLTRFEDLMGSFIAPSQTPYRGKVILLVCPENSSATFEFAYQVQRLKLGTLVGRPTEGSLQGINGGAFFFLTLPNSRIEVDVPLIAQFSPEKRPDRGVLPDVPIEPTAADIAAGRDVEMSRVHELIGKG